MRRCHSSANYLIGPLISNNHNYSEQQVSQAIKTIAHDYDVTCITEKQKTALSKALFNGGIISAIEHAILSLPNQQIKDALARQPLQTTQTLNLIQVFEDKVAISKHYSDLSPVKAIDDKFLFIMLNINQQYQNRDYVKSAALPL